MATRMQQRRGTAAQWISTNSGAGPVLNAGEIGWESDTNKFKIGDGVNNWTSLDYFADIDSTVNPAFGTSITFEGATADSYETTLQVTDPTADRTITLPNVTGTVITTGNLSDITNIGVFTSTITMEGSSADDFELTLSATDPTADRTITFPDATGTVALTTDIAAGTVTETGTQTLTNKTLTSPVVSGLTLSDSGIVIEGSSADAHETTLTVTNPTADRTITFPDETGTVQLRVTDVSDTEIGYLNGVTSAIQTQMDAKASLASPTFTGTVTLPSGTVTSTMILDGTIATADIADSAITSAKIADGTIVAGDIADGAITTAKILDGTIATGDIADSAITSAKIANDTIVDADINSAAAIAQSKISGLTTDLAAKAPLAAPAFTGTATAVNLTISGDLTVNGTTTNINSTSLVVEDKNVILGDVATPSDTTADGGGITLKGLTDKTFNWVDSTDAWTSSEHINLASGKTLKYNGTDLVAAQSGNSGKYLTTDGTSTSWGTISGYSAPTLGSTSIASGATVTSIAGLTLSSGTATTAFTLNATAELRLADTDSSHYVGFKSPGTVTTNKIWTLPSADGSAGQTLSTDGSATLSWSTPAQGAAFSELMLIGA